MRAEAVVRTGRAPRKPLFPAPVRTMGVGIGAQCKASPRASADTAKASRARCSAGRGGGLAGRAVPPALRSVRVQSGRM